VPKQFTYGYAITCHKAQGSEFEKVLVVEEKFPFDKEEHARWLYTGCTRASEKLVIIQKD
jgi:ATP-dependent exoDNAse (exonuclease V) alpha subunit